MTLATAITYIVAKMDEIPEVKVAPANPTEGSISYPYTMVYPANGRVVGQPTLIFKEIHFINIDFVINRSNLPNAYKQITPLLSAALTKFAADPTLGGNVTTIISDENQPITYTILYTELGGTPVIVLRIILPVKVRP